MYVVATIGRGGSRVWNRETHFLSSFFSLSLVSLFSFFLLFTMPKFIREGLVGLQWTTWGRGLEPPVPTLAPPLIDSSSVANSRLAYIVDMLCLLYLFVLTYIL